MPWWPKPDTATFGGVGPLQIIALVLCFVIPSIGWILLFRQVGRFFKLYRLGRSENRRDQPGARTWTLIREFLGHTRMSRLPVVSVAHWFTALSFLILFATLVNAFFQLVRPDYRLPLIGHFPPFEWLIELFAWAGLIGIIVLMVIRQKNHPRSAAGTDGRRSRFFGSTWWQAYYVEFTILAVCICILLLRTLEAAMVKQIDPATSIPLHFPLSGWLAGIWGGLSVKGMAQWVYLVAMVKILISFAWMITISLTPTMGVAWHRFLAFPNIWFKRNADGRTALGAAKEMTVDGQPFSMEAMEELDEETTLGVGKVEDFTWKGLLDFSTCTECGRCQSQCPAWNTDKPLSPKLLMMTLRNHSNAKAPYLRALRAGDLATDNGDGGTGGSVATDLAPAAADGEGGVATLEAKLDESPSTDAINWDELALVGQTGYDIEHPLTAYNPHGPDAVIDEDVLWSCTTCGACVEQCPVDIEHVDHIIDMRRYQNLIESAFPSELGGLFKNLESKGNPWGMNARARMEWAKDLPFEVKVLGSDVESADDVEWLFWVGCAGAYEDRAKKTSRAVAELLHTAGVEFAVLGDGETCTGDSARRAGNEVLFQMLAQQNVETLNEMGAKKIVVTCAHCFNTIKNEYPQVGGNYEVVHHTQLLNRLVREKKLTPVARPSAPVKSTAKNVASAAPTVTYHDPCYLGRHNGVYAPPRELIGALPGVELKEMERTKEKSFCCGAGGARMWMEEKLGTRINVNRTEEAIATGADRIAVGCPFCRVMLSDGLTAQQSEGASEDIEVVDIAQMLLAAVRRGDENAAEAADEAAPAAIEAKAAPEADEKVVEKAPVEEKAAETAPAAEKSGTAAAAGATAAAGAAAAGAAAADEGDPWDSPAEAPAKAEPKAEAAAEADPWDAPAAPTAKAEEPKAEEAPAAAASDDVDPWDTPGDAAPAKAEAAPAAADTDADPWDTPAAPTAKAEAPAEEAPAAATSDDVDPWDEPATAAPAAKAEAPAEEPKAAEEAPAAEEPKAEAAAPAAGADDVLNAPDPWDEPGTATPAAAAEPKAEEPKAEDASADEGQQPEAEAPVEEAQSEAPAEPEPEAPKAEAPKTEAAPAVDNADDLLNAPDPWDTPGDSAPAATAPAAPELEAEAPAEEPQAEQTAPAPAAEAPANADELLNSKDPWD
ncbi:MAG: (Fe-S)-binding protein [Micrococcales bacterium]|nr:(Fe-S)-binding protein [Micrococcales bacterium]